MNHAATANQPSTPNVPEPHGPDIPRPVPTPDDPPSPNAPIPRVPEVPSPVSQPIHPPITKQALRGARGAQRALVIACALGASAFACGGSKQTPMTATADVPAAQGKVETRRTDNQNTEVELEVRHLAPPENVASGAKVYVVWTKPLAGDANPQNVGALVVDQERTGSLKTKTPFERFDLMVTPEPSSNVTTPSNDPVMKAKVGH